MPTTGDISLYFHIPFCTKKCPYCHFFVLPDNTESKKQLLHALKLEWQQKKPLLKEKTIVSIYFGGGTPSLLAPTDIAEILSWIPHDPTCEITLEANPEESAEKFASCGINRLSFGVQSLHNPTLKTLGRTHTAEQAIENLHRSSCFSNITIDLMYDTPGQTLESWEYTLSQLSSLPITHLSLYNLTIEPHTPFFKRKATFTFPSPETSTLMLTTAISHLEALGLKRYEISAFAKPGFSSRHNLGYWQGRPFLGFGPSAFSYFQGERLRNICHLNKYTALLQQGQDPADFQETLSPLSSLHERLAIALRVLSGVDIRDFPVDPTLYSRLQQKGWLHLEGTTAQLTEQGLLFYDSVAEEIVL